MPIILLFFGIGDTSKIVIIFMILFFQILVLVRDQAANLRPELIQSRAQSRRGTPGAVQVRIPARQPARHFDGAPPDRGHGGGSVVHGRAFATKLGLGYYIYFEGSTLLDYPAMYAGVLAMSLLGLSLYFMVDGLEKTLCRWQQPS